MKWEMTWTCSSARPGVTGYEITLYFRQDILNAMDMLDALPDRLHHRYSIINMPD